MHWLTQLFTQHESVAYTAIIYALTIFSGAALGRLRIFGITFGVTLVLFTGIILSYLGFTINEHIAHFVKEFGLILSFTPSVCRSAPASSPRSSAKG